MPHPSNRPPRETVIRIALEVQKKHRLRKRDFIFTDRGARGYPARKEAWARILRETGCSISGLGYVWGIDRQAIWRGVRQLELAAASA